MWSAENLRRFYVVILGCIGIACALGIAVDLVTAHVAVEYFTVHHPKLIDRTDPLSMALLWGGRCDMVVWVDRGHCASFL